MSDKTPLSQLRHARGWSQAGLAERSGVSRAEISAIETGRLVPSVAVALRLAASLGEAVESAFGDAPRSPDLPWAWTPAGSDTRVWRAEVNGRVHLYPAEPTAVGAIPHDGRLDGASMRCADSAPPERTLIVAGCDPLVGLLVAEMRARHGIRVLPLLRSSAQAIELLRLGLVHAAGLHMADPDGRSMNEALVRRAAGRGYRLVHQLRWDSGVALAGDRRERTPTALVRANLRWVNREEGSAARLAFDALLGSRRRPAGYEHVVRDHRAVAATVSSGWAEAGVCVRPAALEAHLAFVPLHQEPYELCVAAEQFDDPRVAALVSTMQSGAYRRVVADVPGCVTNETGDVRTVT
jgi:molybdate-binding protein/DNA-binding XRE family transcriptional regulator